MENGTVGLATFVGFAILMIAVSVPLLLRRVPPNPLYGLRVPSTYADAWVWYEANAKTGRDFIVFAAILIALAVGLARRLEPAVYVGICTVVLLAGVLLVAIVGWRRANRLLARRRESGPR